MKGVIRLWDMVGAGLILKVDSGFLYSNQTGGTACYQSEVEGIFVPINFDTDPYDFESTLEFKISNLFSKHKRLNGEIIEVFNELMASSSITSGISIDEENLVNSHESWVHVIVNDSKDDILSLKFPIKAVLTWPNSD